MSFSIREKELAKALNIRVDRLDKIIDFFDSDPDDEWEVVEGKDYIWRAGHRVFSEEGAFAIAEYVHKELQKGIWNAVVEFITRHKKRLRESFAKQRVRDNSSSLTTRNTRHFLFTDDVVQILGTNHARLYRAFKQIRQTETPLILDKDYFEDPDLGKPPRNRYYSLSGLMQISRLLASEQNGLKKKNRRDWCDAISEVCTPTVQKLLKEADTLERRIQKAMKTARHRDNNQCQVTGKKWTKHNQTILQIHHIYDRGTYPHLADCVDNLITLRNDVHAEFHAWNGGTQKSCTIDSLINFAVEMYPDREKEIAQLNQIKLKLSRSIPNG